MSKKFLLPDLGEGLPDATIVEWYVKEGDTIKLDENLVSMETAKAVVELPSPFSGKVLRVAGVLGFGALRQAGVEFHLHQPGAGGDHVTGAAGHAQHLAGEGRGQLDHGLGGFHGHQRLIQADRVADLDHPFDDLGVGQAFAQVGQVKDLVAHPCLSVTQLEASVRRTAARIFSTLGRYFISSRNSGMWVS